MNTWIKKIIIAGILFTVCLQVNGQTYFPPSNSTTWDTLSPSNLNWCQNKIDSFYNFLDTNNTKAFILLKDGKIVLERYFDGHTATTNWYWASAAKTLTAFLVGIAQQEGKLNITDTTSKYLGQGWTNLTPSQEEKITIFNQLTMTTGLDDRTTDIHCTVDTCLTYLTAPGTRWAYHNGPYTLLDSVLIAATGQTLNAYLRNKLRLRIGMDGAFIKSGFNNLYLSKARSMARFGLLMLNNGNWNGTQVMSDTAYFNEMINTSQSLNQSYGYLWWLNGKSSFMIPQSQLVFNSQISPNAPDDMYAAVGKNGQIINVVPSQNLVWIRMGDNANNSLVPISFNDDIWKYLNEFKCNPLSVQSISNSKKAKINVYPNPVVNQLNISTNGEFHHYEIINCFGKTIQRGNQQYKIGVSDFKPGVYFLRIESNQKIETIRFIKR